MHELPPDASFRIKRARPLHALDVESLSLLYLPILGYRGLGLYLSLNGLSSLEEEMPLSSLLKELGASRGEFLSLLSPLEGLSLVRTYQKGSLFEIRLFPPSSPRDFLKNPILGGNLVLSGGKERARKARDHFLPPSLEEGMREISEDYRAAFLKDAPLSYDPSLGDIPSDRPHVRAPFDEPRFFSALKESLPESDPSLFSEEERKNLGRTMALYALDEETLARLLPSATIFRNPKGRKIDFKRLGDLALEERSFLAEGRRRRERRAIPGKGDVAEELRAMESLSPVDYLSRLQGGTRPASADVRLVDRISREMGLPFPVINALVNYLVLHYEGKISAPLAEKIAGTLLRNHIETAMDAIDFLNASKGSGRKARPARGQEESKEEAPSREEAPREEEAEMSDEELMHLLGMKE